jgi:hypothetical protein
MQSVAINSADLFVAVGYTTGGGPMYARSTDGTTWTTPAQMNGSSQVSYITEVAVNNTGLFVAVGYNASNYSVYATST